MTTTQVQKNSARTPTLRFVGFSGRWEEKKLGKIATFAKGKGISKDNVVENGRYKCIRYGELYTQYKEIIKEVYSRTNILPTDSFLSQKDDVIIPASGETALDIATTSCVKESEILLGGDINVLRFNKDQSGDFLAYYLKNFKNRDIARIAQGQSVVHLYFSQLKDLKLNTPTLPEQQKIASFLESVDRFLENLRRQKDALQEYRKGMMQKIFTQEIHFKDDNEKSFPEWKEKKLGEILEERKEYSTKGKVYPHISLTTQGVVPKSERYDRDFLVGNDETKRYKITRLNDLCYNPANLKFGVISLNKLGSGIFSPIYVTFEIIGQNIDFVGYYLIRDVFINKARRYEQGTVYERMAVHPSDFVKVEVAFPSLPEQEKIANFLTSIDKAIELKGQQASQVEQWKKGLMQKLFV